MSDDDLISQAIDRGGGQMCDVSGVLRELRMAGFVIARTAPTTERMAAKDVAEWCGREVAVARKTGHLETRPFVQNATLIIKALREFSLAVDILAALHKARIELGGYLQVGAGPSTKRAFDAVAAAIAQVEGRSNG